MRKMLAMMLCLLLALGCAAGLAEGQSTQQKTVFGQLRINGEFTLKGLLPEGYQIIPFEQTDSTLISRITAKDPARPTLILSIAFDETYAEVGRLNELQEEELLLLEKTFTDLDPYASITYDETSHGTRLLICRTTTETYDYLDIFSIYQGYLVELVMVPGTGADQNLTEEQVQSCIDLLSELDFVSGAEAEELVLSGMTYDAAIRGFDAEAGTLDIALLVPCTFTEWETVSIGEGDTIRIGEEEVTIESLQYEDTDAIINEEYTLNQRPDGLYTASHLEMPVLQEKALLTVQAGENLEFVEGIEPEYGEMLDEPVTLTRKDLFEALTAARQGGIGFDSQNVTVSFDEQGELIRVTRDYAPWQ